MHKPVVINCDSMSIINEFSYFKHSKLNFSNFLTHLNSGVCTDIIVEAQRKENVHRRDNNKVSAVDDNLISMHQTCKRLSTSIILGQITQVLIKFHPHKRPFPF